MNNGIPSRAIACGVLLGVTAVAPSAHAITKCKAKINKPDGTINVSAAEITGTVL